MILANERSAIDIDSALAKLREQPQDFEVQPDQGDHQGEGAVPLHVFRSAHARAILDQVEVEHQVQGGDHYHNEAETDADWSRAVDGGEVHAEESQDELQEVEDGDPAGGGNDAESQLVGDAE